MSKSLAIAAALAVATTFSSISPVVASSEVTLSAPKNVNVIQTIGKKPPKRYIELKLGKLRTVGAVLPGTRKSFKERMALRSKRARERQEAVSRASRLRVIEEEKARDSQNQIADNGAPKIRQGDEDRPLTMAEKKRRDYAARIKQERANDDEPIREVVIE